MESKVRKVKKYQVFTAKDSISGDPATPTVPDERPFLANSEILIQNLQGKYILVLRKYVLILFNLLIDITKYNLCSTIENYKLIYNYLKLNMLKRLTFLLLLNYIVFVKKLIFR